MTKDEQFISDKIEALRSVSERLKLAKESLEIDGACPEAELTHEEDPYNLGFIWASICNSLHSATDALNGMMIFVEPGGLKETLEETEIAKQTTAKTEDTEEHKHNIEPTEKLEDDGK